MEMRLCENTLRFIVEGDRVYRGGFTVDFGSSRCKTIRIDIYGYYSPLTDAEKKQAKALLRTWCENRYHKPVRIFT